MTRLRSPVAGVELIPEGLLLVEGENLGGVVCLGPSPLSRHSQLGGTICVVLVAKGGFVHTTTGSPSITGSGPTNGVKSGGHPKSPLRVCGRAAGGADILGEPSASHSSFSSYSSSYSSSRTDS